MDRFRGGNPLDSFAAFAGAQGGPPSMRGPVPPPPGSVVIPPGGGQARPYYPGDPNGVGMAQGMPMPPQMGGMPTRPMGGGIPRVPGPGGAPMPQLPGPGGMPMPQVGGPMAPPPPQMPQAQDPILTQILMQHLARQQQDADEYQRGRSFMTQLLASKLGQ